MINMGDIMYCHRCDRWQPWDREKRVCLVCGSETGTLTCGRCGHVWIPHGRTPRTCPDDRCRSPYYCRERVR